ncbi:MAG: hypothetical protein WA154_06370 [Moraxellaceae bacterium]
METIKVMPWGKGQGDYVLVNREDLTDQHVLYEDYQLRIAEEVELARQEAEKQAQAEAEAKAQAEAEAERQAEQERILKVQAALQAPLPFTKAQLIERLDALGLEYNPNATKAQLFELLPPDQQV